MKEKFSARSFNEIQLYNLIKQKNQAIVMAKAKNNDYGKPKVYRKVYNQKSNSGNGFASVMILSTLALITSIATFLAIYQIYK